MGNDVALSCRPVPRTPPTSPPAPPPLQVDTAKVVIAGAALWAVALVVVLILGDRVDRVWTWTCVCGIALGGIGLGIMRWQGRRERPPTDR